MPDTPNQLERLRGPIALPEEMHQAILAHHLQPQRFYHNINHVHAVLEEFRVLEQQGLWQHPKEAYLAFLYHDAIYEYGAKDNEQRSAELAVHETRQWLFELHLDLESIHRLILLTASHGSIDPLTLSPDEALFLDCDMAIVGANWQRFSLYQLQIEQEYTQVYPKLLYRMGRRRFLNKILQSERIFYSEHFHSRLDGQARSNLIKALSGH